jgi:hypothetical protein
MKKILLQIDTFINGDFSIKSTEECIKRSRSLGYPILLTAHTEIPDSLRQMVDYVQIDLNNILLPDNGSRSILSNCSASHDIKIILKNSDPHAPACLTSIINGARFALLNEFDHFIRIEYDTIFEEDSIPFIQSLIQVGSRTSGCIFTNFENWIDGKFIMFSPDAYLESFDKQINNPEDYISFLVSKEIPEKSWRHLQEVQYRILNKKEHLKNTVQIPVNVIESVLDRDFLGVSPKEVGIFRPARILESQDSFALIAHGFLGSNTFSYRTYKNGILTGTWGKNFFAHECSWHTLPFERETIYKIEYTNPIDGTIESWEFGSLDELDDIATIELK